MLRYYIKNTALGITTIQIVECANKSVIENYLNLSTADSDSASKYGESGLVIFSNERTKNISFTDEFDSVPSIKLTLEANSVSQVYKINATINGFTIKFLTNYSGGVAWEATAET